MEVQDQTLHVAHGTFHLYFLLVWSLFGACTKKFGSNPWSEMAAMEWDYPPVFELVGQYCGGRGDVPSSFWWPMVQFCPYLIMTSVSSCVVTGFPRKLFFLFIMPCFCLERNPAGLSFFFSYSVARFVSFIVECTFLPIQTWFWKRKFNYNLQNV